jgi:hypothetical protein
VPELTKRIISIEGTRRVAFSARRTSSSVGAPYEVPRRVARARARWTNPGPWPKRCGPYDATKSRYERPSASRTRAPRADATKKGSPPTDAKERTGELTPPGIRAFARRKSAAELLVPGFRFLVLFFTTGNPETLKP